MAGPYTSFVYGDPKISPATMAAVAAMVGYTATGNPYPVPLDGELPHGTLGAAYSTTLSGVGGISPYTFAVTVGTLPAGLSLAGSTGIISGTPSAAGTSTFTITVTDAHGVPGSHSFSITVGASPNPVPVASVLQGGTIGVAYSETISAVNGTPAYTFAVASGALPGGLSLNTSTGVISGTPTTAGTSTFAISATDSLSASGSTSFSIKVSAAATGGASNYAFFA